MLIATPVSAIANPDSIDIGYYKVFTDVLETGDMFFSAEGQVIYALTPTDYTAYEAFLFEVLNVAGTDTLASTPISDFGDRPTGIYLTATQVTTLGLVSGTQYKIRVVGNPAIFASQTGNIVTITLASEDYVDQNLGDDDGVPTNNNLRNFMIEMADAIEVYDHAHGITDDYIETVQGYKYLTLAGGDIFINGIPGLSDMCPILFQAGIEALEGEEPETTGTYALTLTPAQKWGNTAANGLTNLGIYMGINQALAGSVVLFILAIMLAVFIYSKTESGVSVLLIMSAVPFIGAYMGLMPIALAFIFVIFIIVLLGYFFFSRGAL
jgi:hypothetical protein